MDNEDEVRENGGIPPMIDFGFDDLKPVDVQLAGSDVPDEEEYQDDNDEDMEPEEEEDQRTGPGGHLPDGTGPHGRGMGPGKGKRDGSGYEKEEGLVTDANLPQLRDEREPLEAYGRMEGNRMDSVDLMAHEAERVAIGLEGDAPTSAVALAVVLRTRWNQWIDQHHGTPEYGNLARLTVKENAPIVSVYDDVHGVILEADCANGTLELKNIPPSDAYHHEGEIIAVQKAFREIARGLGVFSGTYGVMEAPASAVALETVGDEVVGYTILYGDDWTADRLRNSTLMEGKVSHRPTEAEAIQKYKIFHSMGVPGHPAWVYRYEGTVIHVAWAGVTVLIKSLTPLRPVE